MLIADILEVCGDQQPRPPAALAVAHGSCAQPTATA